MNNEEKLIEEELRCPFCGGEVRIVVCDDEGNRRDEDYESDPWSGLRFGLVHEDSDVPEGETCPIATSDGDGAMLGAYIYDSREEARSEWNKRK